MRVVNWLDFKTLDAEIETLAHKPGQSVHIRLLVREMVRNCLAAYPWQGREDLISPVLPTMRKTRPKGRVH